MAVIDLYGTFFTVAEPKLIEVRLSTNHITSIYVPVLDTTHILLCLRNEKIE